jgi:hypothetical protein
VTIRQYDNDLDVLLAMQRNHAYAPLRVEQQAKERIAAIEGDRKLESNSVRRGGGEWMVCVLWWWRKDRREAVLMRCRDEM